jgi:hypothetical protein
MSPDEFTAKWETEARAMAQRGALVNGAALVEEFLRDFASVVRGHGEEAVTLAQAARESGYSTDYLGLLIRQGRIPNVGRPHAPRIRRRDLPRKASRLPSDPSGPRLSGATPRQIARAVVTSDQ